MPRTCISVTDKMDIMRLTLFLFALPDWLTSEKYITLATWGLAAVTFLLVIMTAFLYLDGISKSKEQREHWKGEEHLRKEEAKPKTYVEIAKKQNSPDVIFQCFNLGDSTLIIDTLIVKIEETRTTATYPLVGPPVLLPGTYTYVSFDCAKFLKSVGGLFQANATFIVTGSAGKVSTEPVWFYFSNSSGEMKLYDWTVGHHRDRLPGTIVEQPRMIPDDTVTEVSQAGRPTVRMGG